MDIGTFIAIGLPLGLLCVAFYARPVGVVERTHLVHSAEDSVGALKLVDEVVSKKYLSFWEYEYVLKIVKQRVLREQSHAILADSKARVAIRRASKS